MARLVSATQALLEFCRTEEAGEELLSTASERLACFHTIGFVFPGRSNHSRLPREPDYPRPHIAEAIQYRSRGHLNSWRTNRRAETPPICHQGKALRPAKWQSWLLSVRRARMVERVPVRVPDTDIQPLRKSSRVTRVAILSTKERYQPIACRTATSAASTYPLERLEGQYSGDHRRSVPGPAQPT